MRPLMGEPEARPLVDAAGRGQHAVGPQGDFAIVRLVRKTQRLLDQSGADAEPASFRFDQQKPQPRDLVRFPHQEDRSYILALLLGDPATLAPGIMVADEGCNDFRDERCESLVPTVFLRVKRAMASHDPAHVASAWSPQQVW